ncbi:MAG TPA: hypothetical protein IAC66_06830 [Candidatus Aphodousia gallistercoris]|nr:hypothetical protein [Candidatus Aphodousia gallistercoris]
MKKSLRDRFRSFRSKVVYYLTVPPVHEDEYVNQIMNVKVTWQEAWTTVSSIVVLLLMSPFYEMDKHGEMHPRPFWNTRTNYYGGSIRRRAARLHKKWM